MAIPNFLQDKEAGKKKSKQKGKGDFRQKCLNLLDQIKSLNEERYNHLSKVFKSQYDSANIQKKKVLGFYAQLVDELNKLRESAQDKFMASTVAIKKYEAPAKEAVKKVKEEVKNVQSSLKKNGPKKTAKKVAKAAKKAAKKASKTAKKVAKKVAKKAKKKVAKKTAKKSGKKKAAKKTKKKSK